MELIIHPKAARDVREIALGYARASERVVGQFWDEIDSAIESIAKNPERHHFDLSGMRRCNLKRFPYHILFEERLDCLRIIVVRHDHRNPSYGLRRR